MTKNTNRLWQVYHSHRNKGLASLAYHLKDTRDYDELMILKRRILEEGDNVIIRELNGDNYRLISTSYSPSTLTDE